MDWTGRLLPLSEFGPNSEYGSNSGYASTSSDLPQQQTAALKDLDPGRWRPATSYGGDTSTSNDYIYDIQNERLDTSLQVTHAESLEQSGEVSPTTHTSGITFDSPKSDTSMESDDTDDEPDLDSPMEYARFYGLRRDLPLDNLLSSDLIPLPSEDIYLDMKELPGLLRADTLQAGVLESLRNERLDVDKETATFLASSLGAAKRFELDPVDVMLEPEGLHRLKLELPLLARDHEVEMLALRRRNEVRLSSQGIDRFQLDSDKNEGIAFPRAEIDKKLALDRELGNEKLDVSKETVGLLRDLHELWNGKDVNLLDGLYESYKVRTCTVFPVVDCVTDSSQRSKAIHVSPPLLPVTPPYTPSAPAPEAMQIELASTPEDLIAKDAAAAEEDILDSQQATDGTPSDGPVFTAQEISAAIDSYTAAASSSSPLARKRVRDLHLEPPLTSHDLVESTSDDEGSSAKRVKKVHFDSGVAALIPDFHIEGCDTLSGIAEQQDVELQDIILRDAESVRLQLQDEQLVEIDTTLRVRVPQLEPVRLQSPWEPSEADRTTSQTRQNTLRQLGKECLKDTRKWSGVSKLERILLWAPFPHHLGKIDLHERFDGDASTEEFLIDMGFDDGTGDIDVQPMVIRHLRCHERDDDDDEAEPAVFEDDDLDGDIEEEERQVPEHAPTVPLGIDQDLLSSKRQSNLDHATNYVDRLISVPSAISVTATSRTSAATASLMQGDGLTQFMQLRGKAPRISNPVGEELGTGTILPSALPVPKSNLAPATVMVAQVDNRQEQAPETPPISIPMPEMKQLDTHHKIPIAVSSAFMAGNRRLMRLLQTTLPNVGICERESAITLLQNNSGQTEEADLTISPSTGVIVTTLQKLKQKPLPGQQPSLTGSLRSRIVSTAPRYERLIILVKENSSNPSQPEDPTTSAASTTNPLDNRDCTALSDLIAWTITALSPGPETQILYIPGGDPEAANWLAAAISHNHHQGGLGAAIDAAVGAARNNDHEDDDEFSLMRDETMWERWLRAAGLNAFAAQVVLRGLRMRNLCPAGSAEGSVSPRFGLQAFVAMTLEQWIETFGGLLGGERVLRGVSAGLDSGWRGGSVH